MTDKKRREAVQKILSDETDRIAFCNAAKVLTVEIPQMYLVHIAATGKMGSGDLMTIVRNWAQKACREAGLAEELKQAQMDNLEILKRQMVNVVGEKKWKATMDHLSKLIKKDV